MGTALLLIDIQNDYFAGALADENAPVTVNCASWELPVAEYVVCTFEAENFAELRTDALDKAMKYLFSTWLPKHKLAIQPFSAEKYYSTADDVKSMELWVAPMPMEQASE